MARVASGPLPLASGLLLKPLVASEVRSAVLGALQRALQREMHVAAAIA